MTKNPIVLVLASGSGARFTASGGDGRKLDALVMGKSVLNHTLTAVEKSGLNWMVLSGIEGGMSSTIAAGVVATSDSFGWLILPGDLPLIAANSIRMVASQLHEHVAVVPHWQGQKGHPVGFRHECLSQLRQLCGDAGAASVLAERRKAGDVLDMQLKDEGIVRDIDTVCDLALAEINLSLRDS